MPLLLSYKKQAIHWLFCCQFQDMNGKIWYLNLPTSHQHIPGQDYSSVPYFILHTFLERENNGKNSRVPLGLWLCFRIVRGYRKNVSAKPIPNIRRPIKLALSNTMKTHLVCHSPSSYKQPSLWTMATKWRSTRSSTDGVCKQNVKIKLYCNNYWFLS